MDLPPLSIPEAWPSKPAVSVWIKLADAPPKPRNPVEQLYADGLEAVSKAKRSEDDVLVALNAFRSVVATDSKRTYWTAQLLALILCAHIGDMTSLRALLNSCLANSRPDRFGQRSIAESALYVDAAWDQDPVGQLLPHVHHGELEAAFVMFSDFVNQPAIAARLAVSGYLLTAGHVAEALEALPAGAEEIVFGLDLMFCALYAKLGDFDAIFEYLDRHPYDGSEVARAQALSRKGLPDAAVVVIDDYLRRGPTWVSTIDARYHKVVFLLEAGDQQRASKELTRIYADYPNFRDPLDLRSKLAARTQQSARAPIPENVRHAVWRRDEGRCVQCGSQENLEFDHIIPVSRRGANTERNLQLLCQQCNREKGAVI